MLQDRLDVVEEYLRKKDPLEVRLRYNSHYVLVKGAKWWHILNVICHNFLYLETSYKDYRYRNYYRRTIGDIYRIILQYSNDVSLKDVYNELFEKIISGKIYSYICGDIGKRVYGNEREQNGTFNGPFTDEFNIPFEELIDTTRLKKDDTIYGYYHTCNSIKFKIINPASDCKSNSYHG